MKEAEEEENARICYTASVAVVCRANSVSSLFTRYPDFSEALVMSGSSKNISDIKIAGCPCMALQVLWWIDVVLCTVTVSVSTFLPLKTAGADHS